MYRQPMPKNNIPKVTEKPGDECHEGQCHEETYKWHLKINHNMYVNSPFAMP